MGLRSWIARKLESPSQAELRHAQTEQSRAKTKALRTQTQFVETQINKIQARYDNAQYTEETRRQFWMADYLSAKSANNFNIRRTLRMRSRYEVSNNPYLFGVCNSNADDLIGTGPKLQVTTGSKEYNRAVEMAWKEWCDEVNLVEKLRTLKLARTIDGEGFLVFKTANSLENPVKLYPVDIEADQVTTPAPKDLGELWVDGLILDPITERPVEYSILNHHPGDYYFPDFNPMSVKRVPRRDVIHWFPKFRPGQVRGVPVFTSSLDLFTELRAFRKATLGAAEIAADFAAVLETNVAGDTGDDDVDGSPFQHVPIDRKTMTTLPSGFHMEQFQAQHPATTYEMFQQNLLGEALRPLSYPLNLALGTSQKFNFSSSKLDHINYRNSLDIERSQCETEAVERIFRAWHREAVLSGAIPFTPKASGTSVPSHEFHWPGYPLLDPAVDAKADSDQLAAGIKTYQQYWAERGFDWEEIMAQQALEREEMERLKLEFGEPLKKTAREDESADAQKVEQRLRELIRAEMKAAWSEMNVQAA